MQLTVAAVLCSGTACNRNAMLLCCLIQVALIVVMAHIGCFVPARFASMRCAPTAHLVIHCLALIITSIAHLKMPANLSALISHAGTDRLLGKGELISGSVNLHRPVDQLFTRIGTSDSIETNSSSFMVEMQVLRDHMLSTLLHLCA